MLICCPASPEEPKLLDRRAAIHDTIKHIRLTAFWRAIVREMLDATLRQAVFTKYRNSCYVCNFSLIPALRIHHAAPVSLGGQDTLENLVLLCANCHTLVHFYSSKRYQAAEIKP